MAIVLFLIDGLGDTAYFVESEKERYHSPLQRARTPTLDALACGGLNGVLDPCSAGVACGSDCAHLSLFGYPPQVVYRGRGAFEALGTAGVDTMTENEVAFKSVFSKVDSALTVVRRKGILPPVHTHDTHAPTAGDKRARAEQSSRAVKRRQCGESKEAVLVDRTAVQESPPSHPMHTCSAGAHYARLVVPLCRLLSSELTGTVRGMVPKEVGRSVTVRVTWATEHRCVVLIKDSEHNLSDGVTGTDPLVDALPLRESLAIPVSDPQEMQARRHTAMLVNSVCRSCRLLLRDQPANCVLLRGPARRCHPPLPPFEQVWGLRDPCMIAPTALVNGVGRECGLRSVSVQGATGSYWTDLSAKFAAARRLLRGGSQFVFVHLKAVDDCGHDRDPNLKTRFLEYVDGCLRRFLKDVQADRDDVLMVVTGDHSTACHAGDHSVEPVPVVMCPMTRFADATAVVATSSHPLSLALRADEVRSFDESSAGSPGAVLGRFPGQELMPMAARMLSGMRHSKSSKGARTEGTDAPKKKE